MIEAVFSDSAGGSLKMAQAIGTSALLGVTHAVTIHGGPTPEDIAEVQRHAAARQHRWASAVPLGGTPGDVFAFGLGLSTGDLSRIPDPAGLEELQKRFTAGEPLRMWYSDQPDERCGFYWLLDRLSDCHGTISCIKLPDFTCTDHVLVHWTGCGEVAPEEWYGLLSLETSLPDAQRRYYVAVWQALVQENAPLRAVVNGELRSVPESLYDSCIFRELAAAEVEFYEAAVIGNVLGRDQLRISDLFIHTRIEKMVRSGALEALTQPEDGCPYRRSLRKTEKFPYLFRSF